MRTRESSPITVWVRTLRFRENSVERINELPQDLVRLRVAGEFLRVTANLYTREAIYTVSFSIFGSIWIY